jgi:carbon storage regulator CsrA
MIGGIVKVTVVEIEGGKVALGFDGPDGVSIHRLEVAERIKAEHSAKLDVEQVAAECLRI